MAVNGHVFHGRPIIVLLYTTLLPFYPSALIHSPRDMQQLKALVFLFSLVCPFLLTQLHPLFSQQENSWRELRFLSWNEIEIPAKEIKFVNRVLLLHVETNYAINRYFERNFTKDFTNIFDIIFFNIN